MTLELRSFFPYGERVTYQAIALPAVYHPVKDIQDFKPEIQHGTLVRALVQITQEDLADQGCGLDAGLTHAKWI